MRRWTMLPLIALSLAAPLCPAAFSDSKLQVQSPTSLRNWSIHRPSGRFINYYRGKDPSFPKRFCLSRMDSSNCVAILQVNPDLTPELNPDGFDYGPIPPLKKITAVQAEQLWSASPVNNPPPDGIRTLHLHPIEPTIFFIDFLFRKGHIQKFRVRSNNNYVKVSDCWYEVK